MTPALLSTVGLTKRYGGLVVTQQLNLDITEGETHALIGPNGAGKTTLIAQIQGELAPDNGRILFAGADVTGKPAYERAQLGIARTFQITSIFPEYSVLLNIALARQAAVRHRMYFWKQIERDESVLAHPDQEPFHHTQRHQEGNHKADPEDDPPMGGDH